MGQPLGSGRLPRIGRQLVFTHQTEPQSSAGSSVPSPVSPTVSERSPGEAAACRPTDALTGSPWERGNRRIYRDLFLSEFEKLKITHGIFCMFDACRTRVGYLEEQWSNNILVPGK